VRWHRQRSWNRRGDDEPGKGGGRSRTGRTGQARGDIYPAEQAKAALAGWFRIGNLSALRELVLPWLAAALAGDRHQPGGPHPDARHERERVVVALTDSPDGEGLIRRAARLAARSGGDLLAVHVARPGSPPGTGQAALITQPQLVRSAGGTYREMVAGL
jgi:two-component system, OmpR family, sensor histidine kinase KdpD